VDELHGIGETMDLEAQIARVAVLRTESRVAKEAAEKAEEAHTEAYEKYRQADDALQAEIHKRIDALDPGAR
jgi:hypothetical protein